MDPWANSHNKEEIREGKDEVKEIPLQAKKTLKNKNRKK